MGVLVRKLVCSMGMGMTVDMRMLMGMHQISMSVGMGVDMAMLVGMLQGDGVLDHQNGCGNHNGKAEIELDARRFPEQQDAEDHTQEWAME